MEYFLFGIGLFIVGFVSYVLGFARAWGLWDKMIGHKLTAEERAKMNGDVL